MKYIYCTVVSSIIIRSHLIVPDPFSPNRAGHGFSLDLKENIVQSMLRKVTLNLKHFTSWFIKGEKNIPNQTKQPQKPVCNESCYFSITIILFNTKRQRILGPAKSWNSLKAVPNKLVADALSRTLCFLWTLVKACFGD